MISELREFATVGAIATYCTSRPDLWSRFASYVDKIMTAPIQPIFRRAAEWSR